jgi:hypothetical protein
VKKDMGLGVPGAPIPTPMPNGAVEFVLIDTCANRARTSDPRGRARCGWRPIWCARVSAEALGAYQRAANEVEKFPAMSDCSDVDPCVGRRRPSNTRDDLITASRREAHEKVLSDNYISPSATMTSPHPEQRRYLILDRDPLYTREFRDAMKRSG